jgi:hypothetical protein
LVPVEGRRSGTSEEEEAEAAGASAAAVEPDEAEGSTSW